MIKFIEWLSGYFSGIEGASYRNQALNFIDGYAYGYQKCEVDAGRYGFI
ncbi:MAG: hypothetical protein ACTSV7_00640 [Candidatus Baldrarchaeia archaeon]